MSVKKNILVKYRETQYLNKGDKVLPIRLGNIYAVREEKGKLTDYIKGDSIVYQDRDIDKISIHEGEYDLIDSTSIIRKM